MKLNLLSFLNSIPMNHMEFIFFILAIIILYYYFRAHLGSGRDALVSLVICITPIYLAVERCSQFLTVDETYIINESIHLDNSDLSQWRAMALKTTDILMAPLVILQRLLTNLGMKLTETELKMTWKLFHWSYALSLLIWIHYLLSKYFLTRNQRRDFLVLFFAITLLLPTNIIAFKVFNYDKLSMLLGVIALLYMVVSWQYNRSSSAIIAISIACLAAQEKLVASPIVLTSIVSYASLTTQPALVSLKQVFIRVLEAFLICIVIGTISVLLLSLVHSIELPIEVWHGIMSPVTSWLAPIVVFMFGISNTQILSLKLQLLALFLSFLACTVAATLIKYAIPVLKQYPKTDIILKKGLPKFVLAFLIFSAVVGFASTWFITAYWHPYFPITDGDYYPKGEFNSTRLHYGAHTFAGHLARSVGFAYAVLINGLPTGVWLLLGIALIRFRADDISLKNQPSLPFIALAFALLLPLTFGLFQLPIGNKYLNISFLLIAISCCLLAARQIAEYQLLARASIIGVIYLLVILEVFPFRPLYLAFRPFWSSYPDANSPALGKIPPSIPGWGEEALLATELISKNPSLGQGCGKIQIYSNYPGEILSISSDKAKFEIIPYASQQPLSHTNCDFYLYNRLGSIQKMGIGSQSFPTSIVPDARISYRGYDAAWLFRGDRIANEHNEPK